MRLDRGYKTSRISTECRIKQIKISYTIKAIGSAPVREGKRWYSPGGTHNNCRESNTKISLKKNATKPIRRK